MTQTLVIVRCTNLDERVSTLIEMFNKLDDHISAVAVPDRIGKSTPIPNLNNVPFLSLDNAFVESNGLHFFKDRTGWLCGDYVFYRTLDLQWDFAWVVEPDVHFLNGAESFVRDSVGLEHDLLGTHLWKASKHWHWSAPLEQVAPGVEVYGLAFPFLRVSRQLALDSLAFRRSFTDKLEPGDQVPNDESVVSSIAKSKGRSRFDIKSANPELFKYWRTTVKFPVDDIADNDENPRIIHSGTDTESFLRFAHFWWDTLPNNPKDRQEKLLASLNACSNELRFRLLTELVAKRSGL